MLLLKSTKRNFQEILSNAFIPLVVLPAASKDQANDLAVTARIDGLGVTVVESTTGELFVLASDNESQAVGFARKMLRESKTGEPWFLLLREENGPLLLENINRIRKGCTLTNNGFILPDRDVTTSIVIVASYIPAQRIAAWGHHLGHYVGEHL